MSTTTQALIVVDEAVFATKLLNSCVVVGGVVEHKVA
jgi:hypothetical protein